MANTATKKTQEGTVYTERARYYTPSNGFDFKVPDVPSHVFVAERDRAMDPTTGTGLIELDLSDRLETGFPATTPLLLARYARIQANEELSTTFKASGEIYYVIAGAGESTNGADVIAWKTGDVFCLPGGGKTTHKAADQDGVLYVLTNEPQLAYEHAEPPAPGNSAVEAVHYPAEEIDRQLNSIHARVDDGDDVAGRAVLFSSAALERMRTTIPSLTLAMNSLETGGDQRPHRHNSVAITLGIQTEGVHSMIDGEKVEWQENAAMVTPPAAVHSHHSRGNQMMKSLVVQDGGLHYHCRTMGFSFAD
jgi:gentisate 1,2-dioxygenase